jgi:phospholipid/cholesterol/gamma-HCH transport system permease protein
MPYFQSDNFDQRWSCRFLATILLGGQIVMRILQGKTRYHQILEEMATVGLGSLSSVLLTTCFAAMIFTVQTAEELIKYGAVSTVGGAFAIAFCRELAPILTASVVAGQVGSAYAAEIGAMQVTEQIDALLMLRTNPIDYLVVPRVIACCLMLPVLTVIALIIGIVGSVFVANHLYQIEPASFLNSIREFLTVKDLVIVLVKSFLFGSVVALIGCNWGLTTKGGVKGIGKSATAAVVTSWIWIFIVDFFLTLITFKL